MQSIIEVTDNFIDLVSIDDLHGSRNFLIISHYLVVLTTLSVGGTFRECID